MKKNTNDNFAAFNAYPFKPNVATKHQLSNFTYYAQYNNMISLHRKRMLSVKALRHLNAALYTIGWLSDPEVFT